MLRCRVSFICCWFIGSELSRRNSVGQLSLAARGGKNEAKAVRIAKPKDPHTPRVGRLGIEHGSRALGVRCDRVDVLGGGDLERESLSLHAIDALGAILLGKEDTNLSCSQTDGDQLAIAFMLPVEREAEDVAIPGETESNVGDGEGSSEVFRD